MQILVSDLDSLELTPVELQGLLAHVRLQSIQSIWWVLQGDCCPEDHCSTPANGRTSCRACHNLLLCELEGHFDS